jgi:cytochrome c biogenesis protein CcmG, thiol:disulfide interchange protein DsbE
MPRRTGLIAALCIGVAACLAVAIGAIVGRSDDDPVTAARGPKVGTLAPDWTLRGINDDSVSLSAFSGSPRVLAFGASWCHPCRMEYPMLQDALNRNSQLRVVGVLHDDAPGIMRRFMRDVGASWPVADDRDGTVAARYAITGLPETYFISRSGEIVAHITGEMSKSVLDEHLASILAPIPYVPT